MSISISPRTDYSALFSSMTPKTQANNNSWAFGGAQSASGVNLSDYASIKNGSYGKLLKAYYAKDQSKTSFSGSEMAKKVTGNSYDSTSTNTALSKETSALSKSADALMQKGKDSLFEEKDIKSKDENGAQIVTRGYDREAIYKAVSAFTKDYNDLLDTASKSNNTSVLTTAANMTGQTSVYSKALSNIGITVGDDNKLTIDRDKFDQADVEDIKAVFNGSGSLADSTKGRADMIAGSAQSDALKAGGTYASNGLYANAALLNGASFTGFV